MSDSRPSWDTYFMEIVFLIAKRSTCLRRKVGAVIVKHNQILASGYNGVPSGITHCDRNGGCLRDKMHIPSGEHHELCRGLHAEQNAIIQAAYHGVSIRGSTMYCTTKPCIVCTKMIINAGIKRIVFSESYRDILSEEMLAETDIQLERFEPKPNEKRIGDKDEVPLL